MSYTDNYQPYLNIAYLLLIVQIIQRKYSYISLHAYISISNETQYTCTAQCNFKTMDLAAKNKLIVVRIVTVNKLKWI